MAHSGSNKKVANRLVALSSAAVLAVYSAGYFRTRSAADRFALHAAERRPSGRTPHPGMTTPVAEFRPVAASASAVIPIPAAPTPSDRKRETAIASNLTEPSKPSPTPTEVPSATTAPVPVETPAPAPVEVPAPAPAAVPAAAPVPVVVEQKAEVPAAAPPEAAKAKWKDGTYTGWGVCRHGEIQASVVIEGGRILSAAIIRCQTRYSCSVIDALIPQVAQRQSVDVDSVSGATQSADAFSDAVFDALFKAK